MAQKVIWSLKDPEISRLARLTTEKQLRYSQKQCMITSKPLIMDLAATRSFPDLIVDKKPKSDLPYKFDRLHIVRPKILARISGLKNAGSGIAATLPIPESLSVESFDAAGMIIIDGVHDPGELGTLLRSAAAFDWRTVWVTHSCADPFDPVCIRASQGALFSLPYRIGSLDNAIKHSRKTKHLLKMRFISNSDSSGISLGVTNPQLSESAFHVGSKPACCLLIQNGETLATPRALQDFKHVSIAGVDQISKLPLSVAGSTLMHIISDRYMPS
jgi:tRNA G18 (ribose-2'-O)-methylase SpoU